MGVNPVQQEYTYCGLVKIGKNALDEEPVLADGMYTAKLTNGAILKFSADEEFTKGTVNINEEGKLVVSNAFYINIQGSDKDDNIRLFNCRGCDVNIAGGGADKVELSNSEGYGFNTVSQDKDDVTYIKLPDKNANSSPKSQSYGYWRVQGENIFTDYDYNRSSGL